jgi:hypothetical protein
MVPAALQFAKRPTLVAAISMAVLLSLVLVWLKFPTRVPLIVLIPVGIMSAAFFLCAETMVLLRFIRGGSAAGNCASISFKVSRRLGLSCVLTLLICNAIFYFWPSPLDTTSVIGGNLGVVIAWVVVLTRLSRNDRHRQEPRSPDGPN